MKGPAIGALSLLAVMITAACQGTASPATLQPTTPTQTAAATSTTLAEPSTPAPSPSPSVTPGHTALPTPHAVTDVAELVDYWWAYDPIGFGPDTIHFGDEGQYVVGHGPSMGELMGEGGYALTDSVLEFATGWFDCKDNAVGHYRLAISYDSRLLNFTHLDDQCATRASHLASEGQWQRGRPPRP